VDGDPNPVPDEGRVLGKVFPQRSYIVAGIAGADSGLPAGRLHHGRIAHEVDSYRLLGRQHRSYGWCEGHKTGEEHFTEARYDQLEEWARTKLRVSSLRWRWSTQDYTSAEDVPFIGSLGDSDNVYVATGFGGWGMTSGTVAAMLLRDAILKRDNRWQPVFDSTCNLQLMKSIGSAVKVNIAAVAHLVATPLQSDHVDLATPPIGEGHSPPSTARKSGCPAAMMGRSEPSVHTAPTWAVRSRGTTASKPGTVPATARGFNPTVRSSRAQPSTP
jgi:hypothetical protein